MSVGIQNTAARFGRGFDISLKGLGTLIVSATDTVLDWQDRVRQRRNLLEMDDHLLRDIGLSRADLEHEAAKPFWRA